MRKAATSKSTIKPHNLPPTENAAYFHFLRVHLQVIEWKTLMNVTLNPTDWGWKLSGDSYEPIMTDLEPAPKEILRFIRCNCKMSTKYPCNTNVCTCKKHGLVCVSACGDCNGVDCENTDNRVYYSSDDNDDDI